MKKVTGKPMTKKEMGTALVEATRRYHRAEKLITEAMGHAEAAETNAESARMFLVAAMLQLGVRSMTFSRGELTTAVEKALQFESIVEKDEITGVICEVIDAQASDTDPTENQEEQPANLS